MRTEPSEDDMRNAWQRCVQRRRSTWPDTFEEAMADPVLSRLVRLTAMHPPRAHRQAEPARPRTFAAGPGAPRRGHSLPLPGIAAGYDRKRAAGGDRDDD